MEEIEFLSRPWSHTFLLWVGGVTFLVLAVVVALLVARQLGKRHEARVEQLLRDTGPLDQLHPPRRT